MDMLLKIYYVYKSNLARFADTLKVHETILVIWGSDNWFSEYKNLGKKDYQNLIKKDFYVV